MNLQRKVLVIVSLTIICLIVALYITSQTILLSSYTTLEEQYAHQDIERTRSALLAKLENLDSFTHDWAAWDDTYAFIQDGNEDYATSNLIDETFIDSELNTIIFVNSEAGIVYSKFFDLGEEEEIPVPEELLEHINLNDILLRHDDTDSFLTGIFPLPRNPLLIASRPILTSENEGPILGTLIMGYYLDPTQASSIAETTHLAVNIWALNDSQMPADTQKVISSLSGEDASFVTPLNAETIAGYSVLNDIYEQPALALRVDSPRSIYQQGISSISYFILALVAIGFIVMLVIAVLLQRTVLSRLAQLGAAVNNMRQRGDLTQRIPVDGEDELSTLTTEINEMLETLEQSQSKLQSMNEKLRVVGDLTRHDVLNKLSGVTANAYLANQKLTENHEASRYLTEIESAVEQVEKVFDFAKNYERLGVEELSYIDVESSVEQAVSLIPNLLGIEVTNDTGGLVVVADSLLTQLFYNLIENAIKYGEKLNQITVYYEKECEDKLRLVFEDNGIGITQAEKEAIFSEGYGKGTGYGLYLIRKMCEVYGWSIRETGKHGTGAQFTITIPKVSRNGKINFQLESEADWILADVCESVACDDLSPHV